MTDAELRRRLWRLEKVPSPCGEYAVWIWHDGRRRPRPWQVCVSRHGTLQASESEVYCSSLAEAVERAVTVYDAL